MIVRLVGGPYDDKEFNLAEPFRPYLNVPKPEKVTSVFEEAESSIQLLTYRLVRGSLETYYEFVS